MRSVINTSVIHKKDEATASAITLSEKVAFFLAVSPVLDPYILFELGSGITIRLNDVLAIIFVVLCFSKSTRPKKNFLLIWCLGFFVITLLAFFGINKEVNFVMAIKNIIIWIFYSILISYLWTCADRNDFFKFVQIIGMIAAAVVILQFIFGHLRIPMWNGNIPGLHLSKYDAWAGYIDRNTGDIRPNGIFQESSYVGIYLLAAYAYAVKQNKLWVAVLFAVGMFLTTSMVAVLGCIFITLYLLIAGKKLNIERKVVRRFLFVIILLAIVLIILIAVNNSVRSAFVYILRRLLTFTSDLNGERMSSTKLRLIGNLSLFSRYGPWQKIFGVGAAQYPVYFNTIAYSNNFVTVLLDYGMVGFIMFSVFLVQLYRKTNKTNKIFFLITLIIFAVDRQWFNWYFLYLLTPCIISEADKSLKNSKHG